MKEIQFDDRLLFVGVAAGLVCAAAARVAGAGLVGLSAAFIGGTLATTMILGVVLTPIAWFFQLRDAEGRTSAGAAVALFWRTLLGLVFVGVFCFAWLGLLPAALTLVGSVSPLAAAALAALIGLYGWWAFVADVRKAYRLRKVRSALNTIDLSKSRDISLK